MADREKVIRGIQHEASFGRGKCGHYCSEKDTVSCEYDKDGTCILHWAADALSLLKAQRPRLLTLDEAKALPYETDIWIEYLNSFNEPVTCAATICHNTKSYFTHRPADVLYHWYDYGKGFVIWSGRPTDEQQKAVKWHA